MTTQHRITREHLGRGWAFPIRLNGRGGLAWSTDEQSVREAIWVILSTAPGERPMRPDFGCGIHELVFQPNSPATRAVVAQQVRQALLRWEPRIDVLEVRVTSTADAPNRLLIRIDYRIRAINIFSNLVYPLYIEQAAGA